MQPLGIRDGFFLFNPLGTSSVVMCRELTGFTCLRCRANQVGMGTCLRRRRAEAVVSLVWFMVSAAVSLADSLYEVFFASVL